MSQPRVLLGMSGGVDSSAAALLLQQQGYEVIGCTLDMFSKTSNPLVRALAPSAQLAIQEAAEICVRLGIEHVSEQAGSLFEQAVVNPFCELYWNAQTPNPCVLCNPAVKFFLMDQARQRYDCEFMATGHYARTGFDEEVGRYWLGRARDEAKDQSYFLYTLNQDILAHTFFPLGDLTKPEVRAIAGDAEFKNAQKPESQDICFIQEGSHVDFILKSTSETPEPGPIVDRAGNYLGEHTGLIYYTVGQRKGIGVAAAEPLYVFAKDKDTNTLIVDFDANTKVDSIHITDVNYVSIAEYDVPEYFTPFQVQVKTHYRQKPQAARIEPLENDSASIVFDEPQRACAPGQAAVCYVGDRVVCGGTIV